MIDETVAEIQEMQTHSSSVVAVKAARALRELVDREYATLDELERDVEHNVGALRRANPSHASLYKAMHEVSESVVGEADSVDDAKARLEAAIERVVDRVETGKTEAAANAATTFADGETFLTHDYSSTVLEAIEAAAAEGAHMTAHVTEARPRYLGRKCARALAAVDRVDPHLSVDGAAGYCLEECDRVVVGMSCIVGDTLYNRVGTFPIAAAANELGVPVVVVGSSAKLIDDGFQFENEFRPPSEVLLEPTEGVAIDNPAYDATPTRLVDRVITDEGVRDL
ncbi:translation initiation factor eIF-2B [Candidatus Halobonum tyrrellensis]|uniref:Initiation factor 2B-like protein n=1 Tax=Candidatus Halobonum tyrrellensis G22 TaxID=1324957 RepID=V4IVF9_9EURY|nr:translation initiation factor eIF-2B [Candidatus Halobonum tyrrellensis]ESP87187.1 initiation factor 2B-like protein [Candidatus Halobonum tyrrellensis G22]